MTHGDEPMDAELQSIVAQVPELAGAADDVTPIEGGLTNHNFRVHTPDGDYVVRVSAAQAGELGIDRENEHHNSLLAAEVGVGAPVIARVHDPEALDRILTFAPSPGEADGR